MDAQPLPIELTLRAIARLKAASVRDPRLIPEAHPQRCQGGTKRYVLSR